MACEVYTMYTFPLISTANFMQVLPVGQLEIQWNAKLSIKWLNSRITGPFHHTFEKSSNCHKFNST